MKRIGVVVVMFVVFALIYITVSGPLVGRVFSTINARLPTGSDAYDYASGAPAPAMEAMATQSLSYFDNRQKDFDETGNAVPQNPQKRLVIKNADLTIVVKDPTTKMQVIATMAESMGGFVVSSMMGETYLPDGTTKVPEGSIVVRIPAEKLDEALKEIKGDAVEIRNETLSGQDVRRNIPMCSRS